MENHKKKDYLIYTAGFGLGYVFSRLGQVYIAGSILLLTAVILFLIRYTQSGKLADMRGLFSISWVGGIGIASFQLSKLQTDWENLTWICFFLAYFFFMLGYDILNNIVEKRTRSKEMLLGKNEIQAKRVIVCIAALAVVSVLCFLLEAMVVGFIPLFSPEPHAYSYFHVSGVHYFTISCILIPALTVVYTKLAERTTRLRIIVLFIGNVLAVAIPILCVSRFQLLFAVGFAAVTYVMLYQHITWKMILIALIIMIPVYVLLTVARRHDVSYLNGIFEMKNANTPIFITQPYIYVANNFENFNCMVRDLTQHSFGIRMLFPFFALTGLKFVFPQLISTPIFITKPELTTLTMFYDAYYDFGVIGIVLFAFVIGMVAYMLTRWIRSCKNPIAFLFYGQIAIYLGLSFFTTWFSNPTTWFWLVLTGMMYGYVGFDRQKFHIGQKGKNDAE